MMKKKKSFPLKKIIKSNPNRISYGFAKRIQSFSNISKIETKSQTQIISSNMVTPLDLNTATFIYFIDNQQCMMQVLPTSMCHDTTFNDYL